jgi:hypothetical protein
VKPLTRSRMDRSWFRMASENGWARAVTGLDRPAAVRLVLEWDFTMPTLCSKPELRYTFCAIC